MEKHQMYMSTYFEVLGSAGHVRYYEALGIQALKTMTDDNPNEHKFNPKAERKFSSSLERICGFSRVVPRYKGNKEHANDDTTSHLCRK